MIISENYIITKNQKEVKMMMKYIEWIVISKELCICYRMMKYSRMEYELTMIIGYIILYENNKKEWLSESI